MMIRTHEHGYPIPANPIPECHTGFPPDENQKYQRRSTACEISSGPKMRSASAKTFCNISSTCRSSFDNVTTPITDRCQASSKSNSATATLKLARNRSFKLRSTCRLSFSDCASAKCSSNVSSPTGMETHLQAQCPCLGFDGNRYCRAGSDPCAAASRAESLTTWKHSRMSPTLTSLKLAMPSPHSKPVRTSLASSLKRFSEFSLEE